MKKAIISSIISFVAAIIILMTIIWNAAPGLMILESESMYNFEETQRVYEKAVLEKGWKIPTKHNLKETMNKYGKDVRNVIVYELCHPEHAYKILSKDNERVVSSLMPCRVAIYEKSDNKVYISRMNTSLMGKMMKGIVPEVMSIASKESEEMLESIIKK